MVFKETTLSYYKSQDEAPAEPIQQLNLKGERQRSAGPRQGWARGGQGPHLAHLGLAR